MYLGVATSHPADVVVSFVAQGTRNRIVLVHAHDARPDDIVFWPLDKVKGVVRFLGGELRFGCRPPEVAIGPRVELFGLARRGGKTTNAVEIEAEEVFPETVEDDVELVVDRDEEGVVLRDERLCNLDSGVDCGHRHRRRVSCGHEVCPNSWHRLDRHRLNWRASNGGSGSWSEDGCCGGSDCAVTCRNRSVRGTVGRC